MKRNVYIQNTLRAQERLHRLAGIVERYITFGAKNAAGLHGVRKDLFGFIDIVAIDGEGIIGIQVGAASGHSSHRKKILIECRHAAMKWLRAKGRIEIWSWDKKKVPNTKLERWMERVEKIELVHFMLPKEQELLIQE